MKKKHGEDTKQKAEGTLQPFADMDTATAKLTANPFSSLMAIAAESGESYETNPNPRLLPVSFSTIIRTLSKFP
jgi:hypothetical protein